MNKYFSVFILLFIVPSYTFGDTFVDTGIGVSKSNITKNQLTDGLLANEALDTTGLTGSLSIGHAISERVALSIQYIKFDETLDFASGAFEQQSYAFGLAVSVDLYQQENFHVEGGFGYEKWRSRIHLPQARWDFSAPIATLIIEDKTYTGDGHNPYIYLNFLYQLKSDLSIGFKYEYHEQLGYTETIFDREKLAVGDIPGSIAIDSPVNFSVDVYSIFLRWAF